MYATDCRREGDLLVSRYIDLVRRIAYHLLGRLPATVQVEDLIQAGVIGLLEAGRHFDDSHGASFETYAGIRIRGAMLDEVRRQDWAPRSSHRTGRQITAAMRAVERRTGREASAVDVARELGVDSDTYHSMVQRVAESRVFSLDQMHEETGGYDDALEGSSADPARECMREMFAAKAVVAIESLPEREQLVLSLYYDDELNLKEIGEVLGVTESRVCQIHGQALARLRARLGEWELAEVMA
jgi:RNA polymerase sigma factor for flagellar operon FliA